MTAWAIIQSLSQLMVHSLLSHQVQQITRLIFKRRQSYLETHWVRMENRVRRTPGTRCLWISKSFLWELLATLSDRRFRFLPCIQSLPNMRILIDSKTLYPFLWNFWENIRGTRVGKDKPYPTINLTHYSLRLHLEDA
jgi:hypothetical protein